MDSFPNEPTNVRSEAAWGPLAAWRPFLTYALTVALIGVGLFVFHDRDGYEGDDLTFMSGVYDLGGAKRGDLFLYRFAWQPLSYEAMAFVYRATDSPDAVFLMAPLFGTVTIGILLHALSFWARRLKSVWVHLALLAILPELFFSSLFFNTTVLGMPSAAAALWLMASRPWPISSGRAAAVGGLVAISTLFRFDFLLMIPVIAMIFAVRGPTLRQLVGFLAGGFLVLVLAMVFGWIQPLTLIDILRTHHDEVNFHIAGYSWDWKANVKVIFGMMHWTAWLIVLVGMPGLISDFRCHHGTGATALVAIAALPLFYPMTSFVSPKYAIPLMMLLPFLMLDSLERWCVGWSKAGVRKLSISLVAIAFLAWLISVEPSKRAPFVRVTMTDPKEIGTHDGMRSLGAYAAVAVRIGANDSEEPRWQAARQIIKALEQRGASDIWFVGADDTFRPGAVGWRMVRTMLAQRGMHGERVAPKTYRYTMGNGCQITFTVPSEEEQALRSELAPQSLRIDLSSEDLTNDETSLLVTRILSGRKSADMP